MKTLTNVLRINALSSGVTGLGLISLSGVVANIFGVSETTPFLAVGIFLVAFALMVYLVSRTSMHNMNAVWIIIILDVAWVIASLIVVLFQLFDLSSLGYLMITGVGLWVAAMAYLQYSGVKQFITIK
jgi:hypothetical protein